MNTPPVCQQLVLHTKARVANRGRAKWPRPHGLTLVELIAVMVVCLILLLVLLPMIYLATQRAYSHACASNLRTLGFALIEYDSDHQRLPAAVQFADPQGTPYSSTWWLDILGYTELRNVKRSWQKFPGNGDFLGCVANPNLALIDGLEPSFFICPASDLPRLNSPKIDLSAANRESLPAGQARGIVVPSYVAISGSVPDMKGLPGDAPLDQPHGRNTAEGPLGVLSASGAFPPTGHSSIAIIQQRDGSGQTILLGEQSGWSLDGRFTPVLRYDLRSAWPRGAFTGAESRYTSLSPTAQGIDGDGAARVFNSTSLRYPINTRLLTSGIVADPRMRVPERDRYGRLQPKLPPSLDGPGHNQGIFSAHTGGAHLLLADGRVQFFSEQTDLLILLRLATVGDGQPVPDIPPPEAPLPLVD